MKITRAYVAADSWLRGERNRLHHRREELSEDVTDELSPMWQRGAQQVKLWEQRVPSWGNSMGNALGYEEHDVFLGTEKACMILGWGVEKWCEPHTALRLLGILQQGFLPFGPTRVQYEGIILRAPRAETYTLTSGKLIHFPELQFPHL